MAGHSHFKNIMHKKGAQDAKKAKNFTKAVRDITIAAKEGLPDPELNQKLKIAIIKAKSYNLPRDKIEQAINKANDKSVNSNYEDVRYNAFFDEGVAMIIEGSTDNKNRTFGDIRAAFSKNGGNIVETGSVEFMFKKIGKIVYPLSIGKESEVFEFILNMEVEDIIMEEDCYIIETKVENLYSVSSQLIKKFGDPDECCLYWKANEYISISDENNIKLQKLINAIEESDDIDEVYLNL